VIISRSRQVIDTVELDQDNKFLYKLDQVEPGVYFFSHNEYQALYMEPGDSLMLRVNTIEFDESLSFTGKGALTNNLMMDLFLLNEQENSLMPAFQLLPPQEFEFKLDSLYEKKETIYNEFVSNGSISEGSQEIIRASIDYTFYSKKELYISANARKMVYDESIEIPESFYQFRRNINLGSESLRSYYPYYRYLGYYLDNLAFEGYKGAEPFDRKSYTHNTRKVELIDSMITNEALKNSLLPLVTSRIKKLASLDTIS